MKLPTIEQEIRRLEKEKTALLSDKEKIVKQNKKNERIKNLRIALGITSLSAPFVITGLVTTGVMAIFDGGLPFIRDEIKCKKFYSLEMDAENAKLVSDYKENNIWTEVDTDDFLTVEYEWKENEDGTYSREIIDYTFDEFDKKILDAAVIHDTKYIKSRADSQEREVITTIEEPLKKDTEINCDITFFDFDDEFVTVESLNKNDIITNAFLVMTIGVGGLIAIRRKKNINSIKQKYNDLYSDSIINTSGIDEEISNINNKILTLQRGGDDNG